MAASHFFLGLGAGVAMLSVPVILFGSSVVNVPAELDNWLNPPPPAARANVDPVVRPVAGYVPGKTAPAPTAQPLPTLQPLQMPTPAPTPVPAGASFVLAGGGQIRSGQIRSGGQPVPVRQAIGITNPADPVLPDGSPILVTSSDVIHVGNQDWRSIRGLNGVVGWVPASVVQVDGAAPPSVQVAGVAVTAVPTPPPTAAPAPAPTAAPGGQTLVVANTDGEGVILRNSPNLNDRSARALFEGTAVSVLQRSGTDWVQVQAPGGAQGWVPAQYLAPRP